MSVRMMSLVWENSKQEGGSLLVLLALADWANDEGFCYPSISTLARKARLGERQTQYIVKTLETRGEVEIQPGKGRNGTNLYRLVGGAISAPPQKLQGAAECAKGVQPTAPKPSKEPLNEIEHIRALLAEHPKLYTEEFGQAWMQWRTHRTQIRKKLTPLTELKQLKYLSILGPDRAVAAIENSIEKGYTGIFEHNGQTKSHSKLATASSGNAGTSNAARAGDY